MRSGVGLATLFGQRPWRPSEASGCPDPRPAACRQSADRDPEDRAPLTLFPPSVQSGPRGLSSQARGRRKPTSAASMISRGFSWLLRLALALGIRTEGPGSAHSPPSQASVGQTKGLLPPTQSPPSPHSGHDTHPALRVDSRARKDRENRSCLEIAAKAGGLASPSPIAPPLWCLPGWRESPGIRYSLAGLALGVGAPWNSLSNQPYPKWQLVLYFQP